MDCEYKYFCWVFSNLLKSRASLMDGISSSETWVKSRGSTSVFLTFICEI